MLLGNLPETEYKIHLKSRSDRQRIIRDKLKAHEKDTKRHEQRYFVQGELRMCPVIDLPIHVPTYHLNNGRTRTAQASYMHEHNKSKNFFAQHQEDLNQQKIQHKILVRAANDSNAKSNIFKELKRSRIFKKDEAILIDRHGMVINGNRRLSSVRELYQSDAQTYKNFQNIPCAIIQKDLTPVDIKRIEGYYQIKKQFRQDYDWVSLCFDIKYEKDDLKSSFKEIGVDKDFSEKEVEMHYELAKQVEIHLKEDWKEPMNFDRVLQQKQIWMDAAKQAMRTKDDIEKIAKWKIVRMVSRNSEGLGDRAYTFNKDFLNRNNIKRVIDHWALRYKVKEIKSDNLDDPDDPMAQIESSGSQYNLSQVEKLPIKSNMVDFIKNVQDELDFVREDNSTLRTSREILVRLHNMASKVLPEANRVEIKANLKKAQKHIERIIKKL